MRRCACRLVRPIGRPCRTPRAAAWLTVNGGARKGSTVKRGHNPVARRHVRTYCSTTTDTCSAARPTSYEDSGGPLHGIKVLDLSRILAAPYCSMVLGDLGAQVWKIEHPVTGDDTRHWGPPFSSKGHESAYFLGINRNKKSIAVDLKSERGLAIIHELAKQADVVLENFPPGKADKLGIGYDTLSALNPGLVYCSINGFGSTGPYKDRLAYDVIVAGLGGLLAITGSADGEPAKVGVAITDVVTGLFAHGAIMAALLARHRTGKGQHVETSLLEAQVATLVNAASNYLVAGQQLPRMGTGHASIVPYQGFASSDGHVIIGALNDGQFQRLCTALELPELGRDPTLATNAQRVAHRDRLCDALQAVVGTKPTSHWVSLLEEARIPCGPINQMEQVFRDPQVLARGMLERMTHPTVGDLPMTGIPTKFSSTPSSLRIPPPLLGQHTVDVLTTVLGMNEDEVNALAGDGVVRVTQAHKDGDDSVKE